MATEYEGCGGPAAGAAAADAASRRLAEHAAKVVKAMVMGRVIPFLGAGVNLCGRPPDVVWGRGSRYLPNGWELTEHLVKEFEYPVKADVPYDLLRVSQYVTVDVGAGRLYEALHRLFDADYAPTELHRFLASVPGVMRAKNLPVKYPLIVTTNYDDVLEIAFRDAGEEYDLIYYEAKKNDLGKFWHRPPGGEPRLIERPNTYEGLSLDRRTVLLKIHGAVTRGEENADRDSYVISEDHYLDYLTNTKVSALLPVPLPAKMKHSHFLFLGYGLKDWNLRLMLRGVWSEQQLDWPSWAVKQDADEIDKKFWLKSNVDILNTDLKVYVEALNRCLADWPAGRAGL